MREGRGERKSDRAIERESGYIYRERGGRKVGRERGGLLCIIFSIQKQHQLGVCTIYGSRTLATFLMREAKMMHSV